jgi:hypothetical protein
VANPRWAYRPPGFGHPQCIFWWFQLLLISKDILNHCPPDHGIHHDKNAVPSSSSSLSCLEIGFSSLDCVHVRRPPQAPTCSVTRYVTLRSAPSPPPQPSRLAATLPNRPPTHPPSQPSRFPANLPTYPPTHLSNCPGSYPPSYPSTHRYTHPSTQLSCHVPIHATTHPPT